VYYIVIQHLQFLQRIYLSNGVVFPRNLLLSTIWQHSDNNSHSSTIIKYIRVHVYTISAQSFIVKIILWRPRKKKQSWTIWSGKRINIYRPQKKYYYQYRFDLYDCEKNVKHDVFQETSSDTPPWPRRSMKIFFEPL